MAKRTTKKAAKPRAKGGPRRLVLATDASDAMRALIARIPRDFPYEVEPALVFDPLLGRDPRPKGRR